MHDTEPVTRTSETELSSEPALLRRSPRLDLQLRIAVRQGPPRSPAVIPHEAPSSAPRIPSDRRTAIEAGIGRQRRRLETAAARVDVAPLAARARPLAARAYRATAPVTQPLAQRWRTFMADAAVGPLRARTEEIAHVLHENQRQLADAMAALAADVAHMKHDVARTVAAHDQMQAALVSLEHTSAEVRQSLSRSDGSPLHLGRAVQQLDVGLAGTYDHLAAQLANVAELATAGVRRIAVPIDADTLLMRAEVGYVLCPANDVTLVTCLLDTGALERGTRAVLECITRPGDRYVDVGAHIGLHTIPLAQRVGVDGAAIAVEPHPETSDLLRRNLEANGAASTVVHQCAVSDRIGTAELHIGRVSGHHSLHALAPGTEQDGSPTLTVHTTPLDALVEPDAGLTVVKIDAEGEELSVLAGMQRLLSDQDDLVLVVEFGPSHLTRAGIDPHDWLTAFTAPGFDVRLIDEENGTTAEITFDDLIAIESANLLFARPESRIWRRL
ncbi:MAG: FkbM family methyltransferase [Actinomycetota bacterium]